MKEEKNILKWFNKELSEQEISDLKQSDEFKIFSKIAHYSAYFQAPKIDAEKALLDFKENHSAKKEVKVRVLNFKTFYKVAAVAVIMLCASYFMFFNNNVSFKTRIAQTKALVLPDNSEVILNSASLLSYNKKKWKNKRYLKLKGEAFFKVSKGQTFTVKTDIGSVEVFGTQFNVKERNNYFEVQCYEGLVGVTYNNTQIKLTKGKTFRIINGQVDNIKDFNTLTPSWLQFESSFVQVPLSQVIAELERQYKIDIFLENVDTTQLFTGTFTHADKNIALQSVTIPLKLSYKIDENTVTFYKYDEK
jgi:ferric-dicitrate binding protein FerR (iron transport regulator)